MAIAESTKAGGRLTVQPMVRFSAVLACEQCGDHALLDPLSTLVQQESKRRIRHKAADIVFQWKDKK